MPRQSWKQYKEEYSKCFANQDGLWKQDQNPWVTNSKVETLSW